MLESYKTNRHNNNKMKQEKKNNEKKRTTKRRQNRSDAFGTTGNESTGEGVGVRGDGA